MFKNIKIKFVELLILCGIMSMITVAWKILEVIEYGEITSSKIDTLIAVILAFSLYKNLNIKVKSAQDGNEKVIGGGKDV